MWMWTTDTPGSVIQKLGERKGVRLLSSTYQLAAVPPVTRFSILRGLIGYRGGCQPIPGNRRAELPYSTAMSLTGRYPVPQAGSLIAFESGESIYLWIVQRRGTRHAVHRTVKGLFHGMVVGGNGKTEDIELTSTARPEARQHPFLQRGRGAEADAAQSLKPEQCLEFIDTDELLLEITPKSLRIRKKIRIPPTQTGGHARKACNIVHWENPAGMFGQEMS